MDLGSENKEVSEKPQYCRIHNMKLITLYSNGHQEEVCPLCAKIYEPFIEMKGDKNE